MLPGSSAVPEAGTTSTDPINPVSCSVTIALRTNGEVVEA